MITHMDNFSSYGRVVSYMSNGIYAEAGAGTAASLQLTADPDGVSPGSVITMRNSFDNGNTPWRYASPFGANATLGIAFRYWLPSLPTNNNGKTHPIEIRNAANGAIAYVFVNSTGTITVQVANGPAFTTPTPVVSANGWYHWEFKYAMTAAATCSVELRIEGTPVIAQAGVAVTGGGDILPAQVAGYRNNISADVDTSYKDLVCWDASGADNTDFLGSVLVINLDTISDNVLNWNPSTGTTGYPILSNRPPNDGQYISAVTPPPAAYRANLGDLPLNVTSVRAVMTFVRASKSDGGDATLQNAIVSAGTVGLGAARPITISPTYWRDFFSRDPATAAMWTPAAVNAALLQINRTA